MSPEQHFWSAVDQDGKALMHFSDIGKDRALGTKLLLPKMSRVQGELVKIPSFQGWVSSNEVLGKWICAQGRLEAFIIIIVVVVVVDDDDEKQYSDASDTEMCSRNSSFC